MEYIKALNNLIFMGNKMCLFCKCASSHLQDFICEDCRDHLEIINRKIEINSPDIEFVYYSLIYNKKIKEIIKEYKFHKKSYLYKPLAKIMIDTFEIYNLKDKIDLILYVPMHRRKEAIRGYNQCELLANFIGKELDIPISHNNLYKCKNTKSQNKLDKVHRLENLKDSFSLKNPEEIRGKRILLIDDIITTGSTMIECGKVLNKNKARKVTGLALTSSKKV